VKPSPLDETDVELIRAAERVAAERHHDSWNAVGAALRVRGSAEAITAIHLDAQIGRIAVCAEAIALGKAVSDGVSLQELDTIVAVAPAEIGAPGPRFEVRDPCGMCRELLSDYAPQILAIVDLDGGLCKVPVLSLIPGKERRAQPTREPTP
jgi:cytidine deaminase